MTSSQKGDWTKVAAVFIAACALVGTAGSCVAAWQSWRTARATENIAREALAAGGAHITLGVLYAPDVDCRQPETFSFAAQIDVNNSGRLAAEVFVTTQTVYDKTSNILNYYTPDPVLVAANSSRTVTVQLPCRALRSPFTSADLQVRAWVTIGGQPSPMESLRLALTCRVDIDHADYDYMTRAC